MCGLTAIIRTISFDHAPLSLRRFNPLTAVSEVRALVDAAARTRAGKLTKYQHVMRVFSERH